MAGHRSGRWQRGTALVPLALVSAAWTASLVSAPAVTTTVASSSTDEAPVNLPDGTSVPSEAIEAPASVSTSGALAGQLTGDKAVQVVSTASTSGIPAAALAAYQRAETVINAADKTCNLTWQLVAAIGRVESNHGRFGGNVLDDDGIATPGIFGIPLNGTKGTAAISDTDGGQLDNDSRWDRAVGPMQFIPSTWSVVGVDADGDAQRNPQDIDDAALATAVYLCSGDDDLSTTTGQEKAVYRYNHSWSYVDLVLQVMDAYASGDYTSIPTSVSAAGAISPDPKYTPAPVKQPKPTQQPSQAAIQPAEPAEQPSAQPTTGGSGSGGGGADNGGDKPKGGLGIPGAPTITLPTLPTTGVTVVDETLSYAQAVLQCTLDGYLDNILRNDDPFDQCVEDYMEGDSGKK